jgi:hypothetical protein
VKVELDADSIDDTYQAYVVDSPLWARWFETEHKERCASIEANLEDLDDDDMDYEAYGPLCSGY